MDTMGVETGKGEPGLTSDDPDEGRFSSASGACCVSAPSAAVDCAAGLSGAASEPGANARRHPEVPPGVTTFTGFGPSSRTSESNESVSSSRAGRGESASAGCAKRGGLRAPVRLWNAGLSVGVVGDLRGDVAGKNGLLDAKDGDTPTLEFCTPNST